jgi:hypothetical protein
VDLERNEPSVPAAILPVIDAFHDKAMDQSYQTIIVD